MSDPQSIPPTERTISGRWLVIGMFAMGITLTGLLYAYSTLHLGPFRPLQDAIAQEFPGSAPRIDGGKKKPHKNTPTILRILVKTEVDPLSEREESIQSLICHAETHRRIGSGKGATARSRILEMHVYKLLKEDEIHKRSYRLELETGTDWIEIDQRGDPVEADSGDQGMSTP